MALVTRSESKIRLGTRVVDFAVLCLLVKNYKYKFANTGFL